MKTTTNSILISLAAIPLFIGSCTDNVNVDLPNALDRVKTCVDRCDEQDNQCNADYDVCKEAAFNTLRNDLKRCREDSPEGVEKCTSTAVDKLMAVLTECDDSREICNKSTRECRAKCINEGSINVP